MKRKRSLCEEGAIKKPRQAVPWDSLPMELWLLVRECLVSIVDRTNLRLVSKKFNDVPRKRIEPLWHWDPPSRRRNTNYYSFSVLGSECWLLEKRADAVSPRCIMQLDRGTYSDIIQDARKTYCVETYLAECSLRSVGAKIYDGVCYYVCLLFGVSTALPLLLGYNPIDRKVVSYFWEGGDWPDGKEACFTDIVRPHEDYDLTEVKVETADRFLIIHAPRCIFWFDMRSRQCRGRIDIETRRPVEYLRDLKLFRVSGFRREVEEYSLWEMEVVMRHSEEFMYGFHEDLVSLERYHVWSDYDNKTHNWCAHEFNTM